MVTTLLAAVLAAVVRSLTVKPLQKWNIGAPAVMVLAGAVVGWTVEGSVAAVLNTTAAQRVAEVILAVLLFVDATEVRGGRLWGRAPGLAARLLLVALPLSLVAAIAAGALLLPQLSLPVLLVLACVVMPIDFASNESVVRDPRLPLRLRNALTVEGGYNDGIVSPVFLFALALAGGGAHGDEGEGPLHALTTALPQAVIAIVVGLLVGTLLSGAVDLAAVRSWTTDQSHRVVVLLTPLASYTAALALGGNGFVATFVCGIAFRYVHGVLSARRWRRRGERTVEAPVGVDRVRRDYSLLVDITSLLSTAMWFVVGVAGVYLMTFIDLRVAAFCLLALTVLRVVPVLVALTGTVLTPRERLLAGLLGPRGTTTIVFGLLAFNGLPEDLASGTILVTMAICVVGSVVLHGLGADRIIARWGARAAATAPAGE
jgi:NhaP-type Na+/H+ or K+/H+ antiporter